MVHSLPCMYNIRLGGLFARDSDAMRCRITQVPPIPVFKGHPKLNTDRKQRLVMRIGKLSNMARTSLSISMHGMPLRALLEHRKQPPQSALELA